MRAEIKWQINNKVIYLGEVIDDKFYTKRSEKHIFRKLNAFGFNYDLIKNLEKMGVKKIVVDYDKNLYEITIEKLKIYGIVQKFNNETQIFVKIEDLKKI